MKPPFPGVDPFVEAQGYWPDFHNTFLNYWREALTDRLPDDYEARLDERVQLVDLDEGEKRLIKPDIALIQRPRPTRDPQPGGTLVLEAETIPTMILDEEREVYLKILHRSDRSIVTILELLSPANKIDPGRIEYLSRRNAILWQQVHLVELDLLATGRRIPMRRPLPLGDFHAIVSRWEERPDCQVYSWTAATSLPVLPIPLRRPDPDVVIDLASVYRTAYERGRYARSIDYAKPLDLPLVEE
jgi:hypothetical protein